MNIETRPASKGIISYDNRFLFVAGKSGRLNLPGGGIDPEECCHDAFRREIGEEVDGLIENIGAFHKLDFTVEGETTSAEGVRRMARWTLFNAKLLVPPEQLTIADAREIKHITSLTAEQCLKNNRMSDLAKHAIGTFIKSAAGR